METESTMPRTLEEQLSKVIWKTKRLFDAYGNVEVRCFFCGTRFQHEELQIDCFTKGLEEDKDENKLYYVCHRCVALYEKAKELGHKTMMSTEGKQCIMCKKWYLGDDDKLQGLHGSMLIVVCSNPTCMKVFGDSGKRPDQEVKDPEQRGVKQTTATCNSPIHESEFKRARRLAYESELKCCQCSKMKPR